MQAGKTNKKKNDATIVSDYIASKRKKACKLVDRILKEFESEERLQNAPLNQLSSVMGTLLDKFGADEKKVETEGTLAEIFGDFEEVR